MQTQKACTREQKKNYRRKRVHERKHRQKPYAVPKSKTKTAQSERNTKQSQKSKQLDDHSQEL